jgi:hypothetical protein
MTGLNQPLGYFRKCAKVLLGAAKNGDTAAAERVGAVLNSSRAELTLMQAQHVVAVEHGFASWSILLEAEPHRLYAAISRHEKRRRFDLPTQERVRELIRMLGIEIPEEALRKPIHVLSIYAITGAVGVIPEKVAEMARRNALERPWGVDIGNFQRLVQEQQALRLMEMCRDEGIPFWQRGWLNAHLALRMPEVHPREYEEICEYFGAPVPVAEEDSTVSG